MSIRVCMAALLGSLAILAAHAADKDTRAGTCSDAKQQAEYFCDEKNAASDSMVAIGTACTNARKNVAAACDGVVEADKKYEFSDGKK